MEKDYKKLKIIGRGLLVVGIASLITYYLIKVSSIKLISLSLELKEQITTGKIENVGIGMLENLPLLVGTFALMVAPLFIKWDNSAGKKMLVLLFVLFVDIASAVTVVVRGQLFTAYVMVIWGSAIYITWFLLGVADILYLWVRTGTSDGQFDVVKLTFIWTVIAFIIGKAW